MFDWENLRHFMAYSQAGSLSAAARALQVDHATVARRIEALERELGVKLVDRRARAYTLTEQGVQLTAQGSDVHEAAARLERRVKVDDRRLAGSVTISAPPSLAMRIVAPGLAALVRDYPGIMPVLRSETRKASLGLNEADIALRLSRPEKGALTVRKLGEVVFKLYGTADWQTLRAADRVFVAGDANAADLPQQKWFAGLVGERRVSFRATDIESQFAAACAGMGIAALPSFVSAANPKLREIGTESFSRDVWLVVHNDVRTLPIVRLTTEHLARIVGDALI